MDPRLAVKALAQALAGPDALLAVMDVDWTHFAASTAPYLRDMAEMRELAPQGEPGAAGIAEERLEGALARRMAGVPAPMRSQALIDLIRTASAAVLGHDSLEAIGAEQAFSDLGFDSLTSLELRNHLATASGLPLPATLVFDYPTPTALAEYLKAEAFAEQEDHRPVLEELDRLEAVMASTGLDDPAARGEILARLEALAGELRAPVGAIADQPAALDRDLATATNDEMFDLLEKELQDPDFE
jgi:acyl carrier protein